MAIINPDGSPYQLGSLRGYDPNNPDYDLFNEWDAEAIRQGGSPIYYHQMIFNPGMVDPVYREVRGAMWNPYPVELWATYEPIPSQHAMGTGGIDSMDTMVFECNYKEVLDRIGVPQVGSWIMSPHLREKWELVEALLSEFRGWQALHVQLVCVRFQESLTRGSGRVTEKSPTYKIDDQLYTPGA